MNGNNELSGLISHVGGGLQPVYRSGENVCLTQLSEQRFNGFMRLFPYTETEKRAFSAVSGFMKTIVDTLYERLRQDIVECELSPGRAFSETELGRLYQASRTPVREVCRRLEREGLMRITPFRGYAVAPLSVSEFQDLEEMQQIFEPSAAFLAADRASPQEIGAMRELADCEYRIGDKQSYREFIRSNYQLHYLVAQATRNSRLIDVISNVHVRLMRFFFLGLPFEAHGVTLRTEHVAMVEAIAARDGRSARRKAAEHINHAIARSANMLVGAIRFGEAVFEASRDTALPSQRARKDRPLQ